MPGVKGKSGGARPGAGRKEYEPTSQQRKQVELLAALGVRIDDIPMVLADVEMGKLHVNTLRKHFQEELDSGRVKANTKIAKKLYETALEGNTTAMIFWLKVQAGWKEAPQRLEHTGADGAPIKTQSVTDLTDEELAAELAKYGIKS